MIWDWFGAQYNTILSLFAATFNRIPLHAIGQGSAPASSNIVPCRPRKAQTEALGPWVVRKRYWQDQWTKHTIPQEIPWQPQRNQNCYKIHWMVPGSRQAFDLWPNPRATLSSPATFAYAGAGWPIGSVKQGLSELKQEGCYHETAWLAQVAPLEMRPRLQICTVALKVIVITGSWAPCRYWHQTSVAAVSSTTWLKNWAALWPGSAPPERSASSSRLVGAGR